jgi:hypothetical protein
MSTGKKYYDEATKELLETITEYCSDTFSANGWELTEEEVYELAGKCIIRFIYNHLDGVTLANWMEHIRDRSDD